MPHFDTEINKIYTSVHTCIPLARNSILFTEYIYNRIRLLSSNEPLICSQFNLILTICTGLIFFNTPTLAVSVRVFHTFSDRPAICNRRPTATLSHDAEKYSHFPTEHNGMKWKKNETQIIEFGNGGEGVKKCQIGNKSVERIGVWIIDVARAAKQWVRHRNFTHPAGKHVNLNFNVYLLSVRQCVCDNEVDYVNFESPTRWKSNLSCAHFVRKFEICAMESIILKESMLKIIYCHICKLNWFQLKNVHFECI